MKIKICGLTRECDIDYVNEAKPDYIGFVFAESRRKITPDRAKILKSKLIPGILAVGVFVNANTDFILNLAEEKVIDLIQLHGNENGSYINTLKSRTDLPIIKAVKVEKEEDVIQANCIEADYLLFDNGNGGTGKSFDWNLLKTRTEKPFFLAGGLNISNIQEAIQRTGPFAVDISSGVESDGLKDRNKIIEIIGRIRNE